MGPLQTVTPGPLQPATATTRDRGLVAQYAWEDKTIPKREIARALVHSLAEDQHKHRDVLVRLVLAAADMPDPVQLKRLEDGQTKYDIAIESINVLRPLVTPHRKEQAELDELQRRLKTTRELNALRQQTHQAIEDLRTKFLESAELAPQPRGYALEKILNELFRIFELEARAPFTASAEQIDGAFSLDGTDYIVEAKWKTAPIAGKEVTDFVGKVTRRLDNTLGLFLSMNGFQRSVPDLVGRSGRHSVLLMDGGDLMAVLEHRIPLPELITRKKRHAAETGNILFTAWDILNG